MNKNIFIMQVFIRNLFNNPLQAVFGAKKYPV